MCIVFCGLLPGGSEVEGDGLEVSCDTAPALHDVSTLTYGSLCDLIYRIHHGKSAVQRLLYVLRVAECRPTKALAAGSQPLQTEQQLDCALDLMRRLPPQNTEENLAGLIDLVYQALSGLALTLGRCHHFAKTSFLRLTSL